MSYSYNQKKKAQRKARRQAREALFGGKKVKALYKAQ